MTSVIIRYSSLAEKQAIYTFAVYKKFLSSTNHWIATEIQYRQEGRRENYLYSRRSVLVVPETAAILICLLPHYPSWITTALVLLSICSGLELLSYFISLFLAQMNGMAIL